MTVGGRPLRIRNACLIAVLLAAAVPRIAAGAGFAVFEHSGRGLGSAFAGAAASAEDPSTVFFNPAGMAALDGTQVAGSSHAIIPSFHFMDRGSTLNPAVGGGPLRGSDGGNAGETGLVPAFYLTHALPRGWTVGLGIDVPFGLRTEYNPDFRGRYHATVSDLKTVNVNPSVAYRLLDQLWLGAGLSVQYAHVKLTNFLDLGTACVTVQHLPPAVCSAVGLTPQKSDAFVKLTGTDWSLGWNLGAMYEPFAGTRFGVAYRSRVQHTLRGFADFSVPSKAQAVVGATGQLKDTDARAGVVFPDSATLGAFQQLNPHWALLGDVTWTHWSEFKQLAVNFANPKQTDLVVPEKWRDSFRYALGVRWEPTALWSFRAGTAYDETAVSDARFRDPRIPDSDRVWLAVGAGYQLFDWARVDVGYAHIFVLGTSTDNLDPVTHHRLHGDYTGSAEVLGIQGTARF